MHSEHLYKVDEIARLARCSPGNVRRWIREGRLEAHRVGGRVLIRRSEVARLIGFTPAPPETVAA